MRFLIFTGLLLLLLGLFDIYFLKSWSKFVQRKGWNKLFRQIPIVLGGLMFLGYAYSYLSRLDAMPPGTFQKTVYVITSIWYLPKILIVPIIFIKDVIKYISKKIRRGDKVFPILAFAGRNLGTSGERSLRTSGEGSMGTSGERNLGTSSKAENLDAAFQPVSVGTISSVNGRRHFLQSAGWAMAAVPFGMVGKGLLLTNYDFKIYRLDIHISKLPAALEGLTIAQISDIHSGSFFSPKPILEAVNIINSLKPDLIMLTGDFVNFHPDEMRDSYKFYEKLKADIGVYGCLGNHDHYMKDIDHKRLNEMIRSTGVKMLVNDNVKLNINSSMLQIAGCDNTSYGRNYADWDKTMRGISDEEPTILLCHDPSNWDTSILKKLPADLTLSGHTHGGQIGFNFFGEVFSPARFVLRRWAGLYTEGNQQLYINRGIGTVGPPVRIGVPPEITLITLRRHN